MINTKLASLLALNRIAGIGPRKIAKLEQQLGDLSLCFTLPRNELANLGLKLEIIEQLSQIDWSAVEYELKWALLPDQYIIEQDDANYPALLKEIPSPPPLLFVKGNLNCLSHPCLAVVGSRNPTINGRETAFHFSRYLAQAGFCVVSGLALGIDGQAHLGALNQVGATVAVMATGIDTIYPTKHRELAQQITEQGALITEFPLGTQPKTAHFPQRNRIISGLSLGVLVVEATLRSGSLITARQAAEQGREIFAIPGSIHNPLTKGCHELIRQGAKLVENVEHITEELTVHLKIIPSLSKKSSQHLEKDKQNLVQFIGYDATPLDVFIQRTGYSAEKAACELLELELKGLIQAGPGGYTRVVNAQDL